MPPEGPLQRSGLFYSRRNPAHFTPAPRMHINSLEVAAVLSVPLYAVLVAVAVLTGVIHF